MRSRRLTPFWKWGAPDPSAGTGERVLSTAEITPKPVAPIADQLDSLIADVARLGREQFRATTLLEGCDSSLDHLSEVVREHIELELQQQTQTARALSELEDQIRARLALELLPVVDALQANIRAARELIAAVRQASAPPVHRRAQLWLRIERLLGGDRAGLSEPDHVSALEGWLEGLVLVEGRLTALLNREGVRPIAPVGRTFDPHYHLAVATSDECSAADGTVVSEEVRGYTLGDRILRHAEVVVARHTNAPTHEEGVGHDTHRRD